MALMWRDRGLLPSLDDSVTFFLPEFKIGNPYRTQRGVTFRQLAGHMAGMPRNPPCKGLFTTGCNITDEQMYANLATLELIYPPGLQPAYSNLGFGLLGRALERVRGPTWEQQLSEAILGPLNMTNSGNAFTASAVSRLAVGYYPDGTVAGACVREHVCGDVSCKSFFAFRRQKIIDVCTRGNTWFVWCTFTASRCAYILYNVWSIIIQMLCSIYTHSASLGKTHTMYIPHTDLINIGWDAPAGQMYSSTNDLAQLMKLAFRTEEAFDPASQQLIDGETVREWMQPAYVYPDGTGFGLPWELWPLPPYTLRTKDGVMNGYNAEFQMAVSGGSVVRLPLIYTVMYFHGALLTWYIYIMYYLVENMWLYVHAST